MTTPTLTGKQRLWLQSYLECFNATEAARRAGYAGDDNALGVTGHRMLRNAKIQEAIEAFYEEHAMPAKEVAWRLARIARADMGDYTGVTKPSDLKDVDSYPVKKIETTGRRLADGSVTVKMRVELHSQLQALEDIGKHHGLFTDKTEHSGEIKIPDDLTDDQRAARIAAILAKAQQRGDHGDD
jgi:phage terminase small subunit